MPCEPIVAATVLSTLAHAPESSLNWSWGIIAKKKTSYEITTMRYTIRIYVYFTISSR